MPDFPDVPTLAAALSPDQRAALVPFTPFSDAVGTELERLALLSCNDGVWTHTDLGQRVRKILGAM